MGRKSVKENKNIYQLCRESLDYSRAKAAEKLGWISETRIENIESGKSSPKPDEVKAMAEVYHCPELCQNFCAHECEIGKNRVSEVKEESLSQIVLEMLASLNKLGKEKDRLIEITADGEITEDELQDFAAIKKQLKDIASAVNSLELWIEKTALEGKINSEKLNRLSH